MLSQSDIDRFSALETSLWTGETRFDLAYMNEVLAPDFVEFGRSGRRYTREATLAITSAAFDATLTQFTAHELSETVVLVTYLSEVRYGDEVQFGNRSSLWVKSAENGWQLRFHQGTPTRLV